MTVRVERPVFEAIEEVRREGRYNMLNVNGVLNELALKADRVGGDDARYDRAVVWLTDHRDEYARAVFEGLEPEPEPESEGEEVR